MNANTIPIVSRVATVIFMAAALVYFMSLMLAGNGVSVDMLNHVAEYADIPLVLAGLTIIATKTIRSLGLTSPEHRAGAITVWLAAVAAAAGMLALDFFSAL